MNLARQASVGDYRTQIGPDYRPAVALFGPQAGALAHLVHVGAEASLCGVPSAQLDDYEDLDEPVRVSCIAWHTKVVSSNRLPTSA